MRRWLILCPLLLLASVGSGTSPAPVTALPHKDNDSQTTVGGVYLELVGNANGAPIWRLLINTNV